MSRRLTDAEQDASRGKIEWHAGGCEATYDAAEQKLVPTGPGRLGIVDKLCSCKKQPWSKP